MNTASEEKLQDPWLNDLRKRHQSVVIYLESGMKYSGIIESFDRHVLSLRQGKSCVLIYKHMVTSITPAPKALPQVGRNR